MTETLCEDSTHVFGSTLFSFVEPDFDNLIERIDGFDLHVPFVNLDPSSHSNDLYDTIFTVSLEMVQLDESSGLPAIELPKDPDVTIASCKQPPAQLLRPIMPAGRSSVELAPNKPTR